MKQIVGLEVTWDLEAGMLKITQKQYINKILDRFGMSNLHPVVMPLDPNIKLLKTPDTKKYDIPNYAMAIGSLMYLQQIQIWLIGPPSNKSSGTLMALGT